jgi:ubiquinone/menaquinone biosynthesis C-methylase UbiE
VPRIIAPEERNTKIVTRIFQLWSAFYNNPIPQRLYYRRVHQRILRRWQPAPGERVLDVGCGTGLFLEQLSREHAGLELHGVDLSAHMLAVAQRGARDRRSPAPELVLGSVYELPFDDASFDVVLNTISCHFYLEQVHAFREIARVLRPRGRFLCAAVSFGPFARSSELAGVAVYHPPRVIEAHLREAGFEVASTERIFPGTTLFDAHKR